MLLECVDQLFLALVPLGEGDLALLVVVVADESVIKSHGM
jgi:hypothetical protein